MGFTNPSATFMQMMNNLFVNMLDRGVLLLVNNILIYSNIVEEHFQASEESSYMLVYS